MKYLKLFESLFGPAEPERVSYDDFYPEKSPSDSFTQKELLYLESVFKKYRKNIESVEFMYNRYTSVGGNLVDLEKELPDMFSLFLYSDFENSHLICFACYKHVDDWFDVAISQTADYYDSNNIIPGFVQYWKCDEFDSLKILLDKWL
jgi:hypothetical protein